MTLAVTYTFTTTTVINPSYLNINFSDILTFINTLYLPDTLGIVNGRFVTADGTNWDARTADASGLVDKTTAQTLTNKTLTSPVLNGDLSGTAFLDEDTLVSDSATKVASQQSIKAYCSTGMAGCRMVSGVSVGPATITTGFAPQYIYVYEFALPGIEGTLVRAVEWSANFGVSGAWEYNILYTDEMVVTSTTNYIKSVTSTSFDLIATANRTLYYIAIG